MQGVDGAARVGEGDELSADFLAPCAKGRRTRLSGATWLFCPRGPAASVGRDAAALRKDGGGFVGGEPAPGVRGCRSVMWPVLRGVLAQRGQRDAVLECAAPDCEGPEELGERCPVFRSKGRSSRRALLGSEVGNL